jgi:flagellar FliJ protein
MVETINSQQNQRFEYDEKRQQVSDLEMMIADFRRMASDLDQQIKIEQQAAGVSDVNHFAYPTFARAAITRRDNGDCGRS